MHDAMSGPHATSVGCVEKEITRRLRRGNTKYLTLWATGLAYKSYPDAPDLNTGAGWRLRLFVQNIRVVAQLGEYGGGVFPDLGDGGHDRLGVHRKSRWE